MAHVGDDIALLPLDPNQKAEQARITKLYTFDGLDRVEVPQAPAGEIVALAGLEGVEIGLDARRHRAPGATRGHRRRGADDLRRLHRQQLARSPAREGKFVTSRQVRERLYRELERNVALRVEDTDSTDTWTVSGRGELHLTILMETMRREGYEFQVSRPRVITREGPSGERLEPYEELSIDVPEEFLGTVIEKLGPRRGEMLEMKNPGQGLRAAPLSHSGPRAVRLPLRVSHRHAGNRDHAPPVSGLRAVGGSARGTHARLTGVDGAWHDRRVRPGQSAGAVDAVRPAGRRPCTRE